MKKVTHTQQVAYNPEELNQTFKLATEQTAATLPGDVDSFKASDNTEEQEPLVPRVASISSLVSKGATK